MKKNFGFVILMLMAVLVLFASCEQPVAEMDKPVEEEIPRDVVEVGMVVVEDKSLTSDLNRDIKYWEFMATPQFSLGEGEKIYGTVSYWRMLPALDTGADNVIKTEASLGRYTSGDWLFELRALNSNKHVIAVGSTQQIVREGLDNTVHITMLTDRADNTHGESADDASMETGWNGHDNGTKTATVERYGSLHVGFVVNRLDADIANMRIVTKYQKIEKNSALSGVQTPGITWDDRNGEIKQTTDSTGATIAGTAGEFYTNWYKNATPLNYKAISGDSNERVEMGKVYYEGTLDNLDAGPYIFTFYIQGKDKDGNWINLGGQAVDVIIVGGEETQVKGTLLANEYVQTKLVLDQTGEIFGSINNRTFMTVNAENTAELTFMQSASQQQDSKEAAVKDFWIGDGDFLTPNGQDSNVYVYSCPVNENGKPAYGIHRVSVVAFGEQGSTGCATIDLIFNPASGPGNYEDIDWPPEYIRP